MRIILSNADSVTCTSTHSSGEACVHIICNAKLQTHSLDEAVDLTDRQTSCQAGLKRHGNQAGVGARWARIFALHNGLDISVDWVVWSPGSRSVVAASLPRSRLLRLECLTMETCTCWIRYGVDVDTAGMARGRIIRNSVICCTQLRQPVQTREVVAHSRSVGMWGSKRTCCFVFFCNAGPTELSGEVIFQETSSANLLR